MRTEKELNKLKTELKKHKELNGNSATFPVYPDVPSHTPPQGWANIFKRVPTNLKIYKKINKKNTSLNLYENIFKRPKAPRMNIWIYLRPKFEFKFQYILGPK